MEESGWQKCALLSKVGETIYKGRLGKNKYPLRHKGKHSNLLQEHIWKLRI